MAGTVILIILIIFALIVFFKTIKIVPQKQAFIIQRLGKYSGTLDAGFHVLVPFIDKVAYKHTLKEQAVDVPSQMCITGDTINKVLKSVGLAKLKSSLPSWLKARMRRLFDMGGIKKEDIDWGKTQVFSLLGYGNVHVNLKGREPEGIVEARDYEHVCETARERLLSVKDPETGESIVRSVHRGSEIYPDATANERPDLVVIMEEGYSIRAALGKDIIRINKLRDLYIDGYHDSDGLLMAYGNVIKRRKTNADICDIMPTILYLLGLPIPEDVDGRVLTEVVENAFVERNHVQFEKKTKLKSSEHNALTEEEVAKLEKHLRGLGYMD